MKILEVALKHWTNTFIKGHLHCSARIVEEMATHTMIAMLASLIHTPETSRLLFMTLKSGTLHGQVMNLKISTWAGLEASLPSRYPLTVEPDER